MPVSREQVYEMLTKEDRYAQGWAAGGRKKDNTVSKRTGQPFSLIEWLNFAEKYLTEAKLAHANFCPDEGAIRIRFIKAASLLVTALTVWGEPGDLERLAGVSSTGFPVLGGGLKTLQEHQAGAPLPGKLKDEGAD